SRFSLLTRRPRSSSRFPYTTLFRSFSLYGDPFTAQEIAHGEVEPRWGQVVDAVRGRRREPARELVLAARTGLEPLDLVRDGALDAAIEADLEVEKAPIFERSPVPAVEDAVADHVEGARDAPSRSAVTRDDDLEVVAQAGEHLLEERVIQIGPTPEIAVHRGPVERVHEAREVREEI